MDIIILILITVFIFKKLTSEFGKISEDDKDRKKVIEELLKKQKEAENNKIVDITPQIKTHMDKSLYSKNLKLINKSLKNKIEKNSKLKKALEKLNLDLFLKGSDNAIEMTIEAFSKKNTETLKMLLSKNLYLEFKKQLDSAEKKKQNIKSSIISLINQEIINIELKNKFIYIDVKFKTEQINFIEDNKGNIISGDKNNIEIIEEIWSFKKDINSKDINWKIIGIEDVK
jgi:predicted lipid-binding transport protein (Tim44 family)